MMHVPIQKIKENISNEAFQVFIGVQTIGNWKSDPWWIGVFGNNPELVPYIEKMLLVIDNSKLADLFIQVKELFPKNTNFHLNDQIKDHYKTYFNFKKNKTLYYQKKTK